MLRNMAPVGQETRQRRWKLGVDDKAHGSSRPPDGMIRLLGGKFQSRRNVIRFQVWIICEYLVVRHPRRQ